MVFQKKKVCSEPDLLREPIELLVGEEKKQSVELTWNTEEEHPLARYAEQSEFQAGFSLGVTEVLCSVLESCQTLLELEPNIKCMYKLAYQHNLQLHCQL